MSHLSTYTINPDNSLTSIGSAADGFTAACWISTARGFYYISNAGSGNLSAYTLDASGAPVLMGVRGHDRTRCDRLGGHPRPALPLRGVRRCRRAAGLPREPRRHSHLDPDDHRTAQLPRSKGSRSTDQRSSPCGGPHARAATGRLQRSCPAAAVHALGPRHRRHRIHREVEASREALVAASNSRSHPPTRHPERVLAHAPPAAFRPSGPGPCSGGP